MGARLLFRWGPNLTFIGESRLSRGLLSNLPENTMATGQLGSDHSTKTPDLSQDQTGFGGGHRAEARGNQRLPWTWTWQGHACRAPHGRCAGPGHNTPLVLRDKAPVYGARDDWTSPYVQVQLQLLSRPPALLTDRRTPGLRWSAGRRAQGAGRRAGQVGPGCRTGASPGCR